MVVCICAGTSEREIRSAIEAGASTLEDLGRSIEVGQGCGLCSAAVLEMLERGPCDDCPRRNRLGRTPGGCSRN